MRSALNTRRPAGRTGPEGVTAPGATLTIERSTTADRIAAALRQKILGGDLVPGTRLREVELAQSLDVSRHTVREALAILVGDGLLTRASYKGVEVTRLTVEDVRDIYAARKVIELAAVEAIPRAAPEQRQAVFDAIDTLVVSARAGDSEATHLADSAVHTALVACMNSPRLSRAHVALLAELRLVLSESYGPDDRREVDRAQREFGRLVRKGDVAAARRQLEQRLDAAEKVVVSSLLRP